MGSYLKFQSVLLIIDQLSGTILLISVNSACTIYQFCVFSFSCDWNRSVVGWAISCPYFHSVVTKIVQLFYDRSVEHIFIQLWLKSISCVYFHWFVTKIDQLLYDQWVVRIFVQLWLKLISYYMIDQLCVFLYSRGRLFNGLRYCHENFLQYFHPFTWCVMVLKKSASCVIDTPLLLPWSIAFRYCHPEWKQEKKPTQIQAAFSINIAGAAKAHYFYYEFFFLEPKNKKLTSQLCIYTWS